MERLIELMESRIRRNVYVRFGGEHLKTYHSNMERRWVLSLHIRWYLSVCQKVPFRRSASTIQGVGNLPIFYSFLHRLSANYYPSHCV